MARHQSSSKDAAPNGASETATILVPRHVWKRKTMIAIVFLTAAGMAVSVRESGLTFRNLAAPALIGTLFMLAVLAAGIGDLRAYCFDGPLLWVRWRWADWKQPPADLRRVVGIDCVITKFTATLYLYEPNTTDVKGQRTVGRPFTKEQRDALQIHAPLRFTNVQVYTSQSRHAATSTVARHLAAGLDSHTYVMTNRAVKILALYGLTVDANGRVNLSPTAD